MAELKAVFKADAGLELNVAKTSILPGKGVSQQVAFDVAQGIITASPALTHLSDDLALASFCPEGFIGIGVPIGTDAFVQSFVAKKCRDIIDDVEKLDALYTSNLFDFAKPPGFNILIRILCLVIVVFYNSSM